MSSFRLFYCLLSFDCLFVQQYLIPGESVFTMLAHYDVGTYSCDAKAPAPLAVGSVFGMTFPCPTRGPGGCATGSENRCRIRLPAIIKTSTCGDCVKETSWVFPADDFYDLAVDYGDFQRTSATHGYTRYGPLCIRWSCGPTDEAFNESAGESLISSGLPSWCSTMSGDAAKYSSMHEHGFEIVEFSFCETCAPQCKQTRGPEGFRLEMPEGGICGRGRVFIVANVDDHEDGDEAVRLMERWALSQWRSKGVTPNFARFAKESLIARGLSVGLGFKYGESEPSGEEMKEAFGDSCWRRPLLNVSPTTSTPVCRRIQDVCFCKPRGAMWPDRLSTLDRLQKCICCRRRAYKRMPSLARLGEADEIFRKVHAGFHGDCFYERHGRFLSTGFRILLRRIRKVLFC